MIKVFITDDHLIVIEGIYSLLKNEQGIEIVGHATTAKDCLQYFTNHTADIILMDVNLPDMNGTDLCEVIKKKYPGIMVLALSTFNQGSYIRKMVENGASGYLLKNSEKHEIIDALKTVHAGKNYLSFEAGKALVNSEADIKKTTYLTKREKEVLINIAEGLTNMQISQKLFISIDTVDTHRKNLHTKLNVKNTAMLIRYAITNRYID
jgi:DNA-binding NarL/FixJ family response regulator